MPIRTEKHVTRQMLRDNPSWLFLFGDNLQRKGLGGQAAEMRGEPNAVGIVTKIEPTMHPPHLERLGIYRPGFRSLPILPPKHHWPVRGMRNMVRSWRVSRAERYARAKEALQAAARARGWWG